MIYNKLANLKVVHPELNIADIKMNCYKATMSNKNNQSC